MDDSSNYQMVIIGNGFDVNCGLETGYKDFFRRLYVAPIENGEILKNFWYRLFGFLYGINQLHEKAGFEETFFEGEDWANIEQVILNVLKTTSEQQNDIDEIKKKKTDNRIIDRVKKLKRREYRQLKRWDAGSNSFIKVARKTAIFNYFSYDDTGHESVKENNQQLNFDFKKYQSFIEPKGQLAGLRKKFFNYFFDYDYLFSEITINKTIELFIEDYFYAYPFGKKNIFILLQKELIGFEILFSRYINIIVSENQQEYAQNANDLVNKILVSDLEQNDDIISGKISEKILSFNYTQFKSLSQPICAGIDIIKTNFDKNFMNIHGTALSNNIIFGIDDFQDGNNFLTFSKSFRILGNNDDKFNHFLSSNVSKKLKFIKFYGQSLSRADYSYFQSIFDKVDLYDSDVKLIFYFTEFRGYEIETEEEIQKQRIAKLLHTYGESLMDQGHGKNLLHKLLLEGRLQLKEII